ncbi:MAG: hypothetical protein HFF18_09015 [Oscillospiraceae bacterium]|nr:hypothetical protein [Oscillospiraceae bacterium]
MPLSTKNGPKPRYIEENPDNNRVPFMAKLFRGGNTTGSGSSAIPVEMVLENQDGGAGWATTAWTA